MRKIKKSFAEENYFTYFQFVYPRIIRTMNMYEWKEWNININAFFAN